MNEMPVIPGSTAPETERRAALHALAHEGRLLARSLIASQASTAQLREATEMVRSVIDLLPALGAAPVTLPIDSYADTFADQSPVIGKANMTAPPASLVLAEGGVEGTVVFDVCYEGPPGHVHGGWIAAMFDEVLGMVQATSNSPGMTGKLEVNYRRPTPLHLPIRFRGVIDRIDGRKIYTTARSYNPETDETYAEAHALFISVAFDRFTSPTRPDGLGHANLMKLRPNTDQSKGDQTATS